MESLNMYMKEIADNMNAFTSLTDWNIEQLTGYKPISTFYTDLGIAEWYGEKAIKQTYNDVETYWGRDYKMFTEFVIALNWKSFEHDCKNDYTLSKLYAILYYKGDEYAREHFKGKELEYYLKTTD